MPIFSIISVFLVLLFAGPSWAHSPCEGFLLGPIAPNEAQRLFALSLELKKLSPTPGPTNLHQYNPLQELKTLSEGNSSRMLVRPLTVRDRIRKMPNEVRWRIDDLTKNVDFVGITAAAGSFQDEFMDNLLGSRHSIPFKIVVMAKGRPIEDLAANWSRELIRINPEIMNKYGYALPQFSAVHRMFKFYTAWDIEKLNELIKVNRFNLPNNIKTPKELYSFLSPSSALTVFPPERLRDRMKPLRESLRDYVMTVPDMEKTWRLVMQFYLLESIVEGIKTPDSIEADFLHPNGPNAIFTEALIWMGMESLSVRIPLSVGPSDLNIVRPYKVPIDTSFSRLLEPEIDHDSKPD